MENSKPHALWLDVEDRGEKPHALYQDDDWYDDVSIVRE